jgi:ubiquinone/menaquinone biosynthesis C-methylase UbiE
MCRDYRYRARVWHHFTGHYGVAPAIPPGGQARALLSSNRPESMPTTPMSSPRAENADSDADDSYLERVKAEIRAEADAARLRAPLPRAESPPPRHAESLSHDGTIDRARLDYGIGELTGEHYTAFVDRAFRALLKRPPDEPGLEAQVRILAAGGTKAEVLGNLRYSPEGRHIGTRVRGLLPRYALAKLARVPVVGYGMDWLLTLAGLPLLLRHQRAADTRNAAQFLDAQAHAGRVADDLRATAARLDGVRGELGGTNTRLDGIRDDLGGANVRLERFSVAFEQRAGRLESRVDETESRLGDVPGLRHYVHAVNHWLVSLQAAIDGIEGAADANKTFSDSLIAAVYDSSEVAAARRARQAAWIETLRERAGAGARILDLGSGDGDWVERLAAIGADAAGVEANEVLARRARERGLNVTAGDPLTLLARYEDAGLDAIAASGAVLSGEALATLLAEARRALKPGGWLLIATSEPRRLADLAAARFGAIDRSIVAAMLEAAGFTVDGALGAHDDVLARRT